ncbi:diaminopimelate decarboxylase [Nakamurella sp. PAMC28650]|uniref:diaminopimelate decarboxylase n=1 Tax=Nakamurella sp. PAMC28650 TaxID=2762325 RepID=UPI00164E2A34|nr:diaminopimelate decarboxylase [Nakamurella sp. PAMC28650]QNK80170.1 diaminopimelate decarboxylase [Nakamurella sp. PAMC28650]
MRAHPAGPRHGEIPADRTSVVPADLNDLDPAVWPRGARRDHGVMTLAGNDVRDLAALYGTPLLAMDEQDFRSRCHDFADAFGSAADVHYAAKAFLSSHIVKWLTQEGLSLDVCSGGELRLALRAGFPPERIALHGSNKSQHELEMAVEAGIGAIVIDSFDEIGRLAGISERVNLEAGTVNGSTRRIPVMIRVTVGVEAHTHEFIATAHEDQKFGFSLAGGDAAEGVRRIVACHGLELIGLHSHIGSQIFDPSGFEVSAHRLVVLLKSVIADHPRLAASITTLDLGGGLGIAYTSADTPPPVDAMAKSLTEIVERECQVAGLAVPRIAVEPGRAIVGPGTVTVYEVGTIKDVNLDGGVVRRYVSVDGGMSDNIRTALYDADYTVVLASRSSTAPAARCRVVGKHCESGDIVVRDCYLPADLAVGDLIAVAATGAYCYAMASNYNRLPRPPLVAVADGTSRQLLRRETDDDLQLLETW